MIFVAKIIFLLTTYFICAIPFGLVLTRFFLNKDVRDSGSGNVGATNVVRVAGKKLGALTLLLDGAKGAMMVILGRFLFEHYSHLHLFLIVVALIAVLAHIYPIYLKFKGGKGVATSLAVLLALDVEVGIFAILIWILTFAFFRISSISSLAAIFSSVVFAFYFDVPISQKILCVFLFAIIALKHKENISRLLEGKEGKLKM